MQNRSNLRGVCIILRVTEAQDFVSTDIHGPKEESLSTEFISLRFYDGHRKQVCTFSGRNIRKK